MNTPKPKQLFIPGIFLLLFVINFSCKKGENLISEEGKVINTGSVAADGCGWQIVTASDSTYTPQNLSPAYQVDNLKVRISYNKLTQRFFCGFVSTNPGITEIKLISITRQ